MRPLLIVLIVSGVLLSAGCGEPAQRRVSVNLDYPSYTDEGTFVLDGNVSIGYGRAIKHETYADVRLVLYNAHRQPIKSVALGNLSTDGLSVPNVRAINVTSTQRPTYVVVESPDFWMSDNNLVVYSYVWRENRSQYVKYPYGKPSEKFPALSTTKSEAEQ